MRRGSCLRKKGGRILAEKLKYISIFRTIWWYHGSRRLWFQVVASVHDGSRRAEPKEEGSPVYAPVSLTFRSSSAGGFEALAGSMFLLAVKMKIPSCTLNRFAVMCAAGSALSVRKAVRRVHSGCSGVLYSGWNPLLRNGREHQLAAGANSDRRMNDGTGKQGISREGPLRSITSTPFAEYDVRVSFSPSQNR